MGEKGIPNVVVMGTGEANLDPLRKARDEALAREAKAKKLPPGVGAAGSGELSTPEELEKAEKKSEKMVAKAKAKLAELFDWPGIEKLVVSTYSSQKIQRKIKDNLVEIKKSLLETVQAAPQSFSSLDETGLENVIKQHVKKENDKLNDKHKILHAEIEKSCKKKPEPAEKATDPDKKTPKLTTPEESKDKKELGKTKKKIDGRKKAVVEHLGKLFKKESLSFEHERDAIRFKEKVLLPGKFRVDIGKINIASLSEAEKTEILAYVDLANGEIKQKIGERVAEVDAFLASLAKKVEPVKPTDPIKPVVSTEPAEPVLPKAPAGEKYLGEEIPENKIKEEIMDSENFGTENPTPKPRMPEEDPEERERTTRERQERLAQLKTEVDQARKEYVEMDYKKKKAWNRLKSFMPSLFKDQREEDQDVAYYRAQYDNKLFEYKNLLLGDAKEKNVSNKELGDLVKIFAVEANLDLADVHTQVKIEHHEGRISGFIKDHSMEIVQKYKKLPLYQKIAIGATLGIAGIGAGYIGGAAVGAVASAAAIRRVFMGMVTGTTVAVGLESRDRGKAEQRIDKASKVFAEKAEGLEDKKKYEVAQQLIDQLIYDEDQKINKIKNKNLRNMAVGIGVGTLVGSASHWIGMLKNTETGREIFGSISGGINRVAEYFHNPLATVEGAGTGDITNNNPEYLGYRNDVRSALREAKIIPGTGMETGISAGVPGAERAGAAGVGLHTEASVGPALENPIHLEVKNGSSLEGAIIKNLKITGMNSEEAGNKAHLMAFKYAEEHGLEKGPYNLVQPGTHIELSPDGDKIISVTSDHELGYLPEKETPSGSVAETQPEINSEVKGVDAPDAEASTEDIGNSGTEDGGHFIPGNTPETEIHHGIEVPENGTGEYAMSPEDTTMINTMEMNLKNMNVQLEDLNDKITKVSSGQYESVKLDDLREQKQMLEQARADLIAKIYSGHVGSLRKLIYGGIKENIDKVGNMSAQELLHNKSSLGYKFVDRVINSQSPEATELREYFTPKEAESTEEWIKRITKEGETVDEWIMRVANIMRKSGIKKI